MKLPQSVRNWTSLLGVVMALLSLSSIFFLFLITMLFDRGSSYLGIFIYIILPVFLVIGLLLIPIGIWRAHRRSRESTLKDKPLKWPVIDLNAKSIRNATFIFFFGSVVFLLLTGLGSYEAFHYTESVEFCGKLCHTVMEPEYVAYHNSSHERVKCVECHVGSGASWYVKSKLSGLYQVYSVTFNKYPRPIPVPIHNLRPARETCEKCHWPEKFYDHKVRMKRSYLADYENTEWDINLLMKTNATYSALGLQEGIHWHINPDVKIEYVLDPNDAGNIPWVRYTNRNTGEVHVYNDPEYTGGVFEKDSKNVRIMDCMECHNRPSHNYQVPQNFIDNLITSGAISRDLPDIKYLAMEILNQEYAFKDSAFITIDTKVREYYLSMYEEILETHEKEINKAIAAIQQGYSRNIFPYMKVNWSNYPSHMGHMETNGCYRCHNDRHKSSTGRTISRDCKLCHNILAQGRPGEMKYANSNESLEFEHPIDIGEAWKSTFCSECHFRLY
ncbi:MAG: NapC/NirT family cytochrome c [Bacteroidales bacterium]|nr:NapC/NirT family cytochrome c [Bacteroidales bacterium]MDZ4205211.1 NapC/NirT family cytochrome c [Bacteroidales bacterium]